MIDYSQLLISLMMVVAFIIVLALVVQKFNPQRLGSNGAIKLLTSTAVGARERISLIQAGDSYLLVGITAHSIQPLQQLSHEQAQALLQHKGKNETARDLKNWFGVKA